MSSPKWSGTSHGKGKRFNPNRTFVMSESSPARKFNPKSNFSPQQFASPGSDAASQLATPLSVITPQAPPSSALEYASLYHPPLHPLQYNTYAPPPFRVRGGLQPHERRADDLFVPADLRRELQDRNEATLQVLPASNLPEFVHVYHSLVPLDIGKGLKDERLFGHPVSRYKAVSHTDGRTYCLLRVSDFEMSADNEHSLQVINKWKRVISSSVVGVVEAFTTLAFTPGNAEDAGNLQSLIIVYEWWPLAKQLAEIGDHSERLLWDVAAQVFSALQAIHRRGLSARGAIEEHFVLVTGEDRVRLGSLGVLDVLKPDITGNSAESQDWRDLGTMLARLISGGGSNALSELIGALISGDVERATQLLTPHIYRMADSALTAVDSLESMLSMELENGRLVKLLAKLEFVIKDEDRKPSSPKYPLVLFMKYVFQQRTGEGKASLNLAHSLAALNKLDAGVEENVLLASDDNRTRLVVSYKELKQMFSQAFDALARAEN